MRVRILLFVLCACPGAPSGQESDAGSARISDESVEADTESVSFHGLTGRAVPVFRHSHECGGASATGAPGQA